MVEIEKYEATDKRDAERRERYWVEELHAELNKTVPFRTKQEMWKLWNSKNKEHRNEYRRVYRATRKEAIAEKGKTERVRCPICDCELRKSDLKRHERTTKHRLNLQNIDNSEAETI
jgi:hypothetical protein